MGLPGSPFSGEKLGERTWVESTEGARARPCPAQLLLQIHRCWTLILVWTHCLTARNTGFSSNTYSFVETLETTKNKTLYNLLLVITIVNGVYHSSCLYVFIEIDSWFITVKNEYFVNMVTFFFFFFKFYFLAAPHSMWDLSSSTRDQTCALCSRSSES